MSNFVLEFQAQMRVLDGLSKDLWPLIAALRMVGNDKIADELTGHAVALSTASDAFERLVDQRLDDDLKAAQTRSASLLQGIMSGAIAKPKTEGPTPTSRHTLTELLRLTREGDRSAVIRVAQSLTQASLAETTEMVNAIWEARLDEAFEIAKPAQWLRN